MRGPIVVGVDGSSHSTRALDWCARYATALGAEVVVVHAIEIAVYATSGLGHAYLPMPPMSDGQRAELREHIQRDWCAPLARAGVRFRVECVDGSPADVIIRVARREDAELVVAGRRGRGGFAELLLGSTTHQLSHHVDRPLVIVP